MDTTQETLRESGRDREGPVDVRLHRIRELLDAARGRDSEAVLADIAQVLGEQTRPAEIYQKPLG